ncbi:MAG TPA: hypothetical protein IAB12_03955 [Candidatus Ornithospirochaeta avicola]|uniref:FecR protein domain-containing protein n=1 Tax=Candidatus Ornithospirochaeta avicola TaxID=2840896 RepID=A0A9D1PTP7_9SPIO|nr:hypothetical protein [Candidatus Ornithospirochaeta avicola]
MKKKLSLFLIMLLAVTGLFASSYVTVSTSNIRLFDEYGTSVDINTVTDYTGLIIFADEDVTFNCPFGDILLNEGSLITVLSWTQDKAELYLVNGEARVNLIGKADLNIYTPVALAGMYSKGEYRIVSTESEEAFFNYSAGSALYVDSLLGELKQVDWLSSSDILTGHDNVISFSQYENEARYSNSFISSYYEKKNAPVEVEPEEAPAEEEAEEPAALEEEEVPAIPEMTATVEEAEEPEVPAAPEMTVTVEVPEEKIPVPSAAVLEAVSSELIVTPDAPSFLEPKREMLREAVPTAPKITYTSTLEGRKDIPDAPLFFAVEVTPGLSLSPLPVKFSSVTVTPEGGLLAPVVTVDVEKKTDSNLTY